MQQELGLNNGEIVFDGSPDQLNDEKIKEIYGDNY